MAREQKKVSFKLPESDALEEEVKTTFKKQYIYEEQIMNDSGSKND